MKVLKEAFEISHATCLSFLSTTKNCYWKSGADAAFKHWSSMHEAFSFISALKQTQENSSHPCKNKNKNKTLKLLW